MPSTYSPLLRLELIGAGEQSGLWGDTTNKNVGQLLEQAIAGVTTVSLSGGAGDYTLSALDGTFDESRSAVLKFIGNPSGTKNIIIPTETKLYVVRNDCGQTITVKTAAQVTGVTLLNGEASLVFCDGTNAVAGIATAGVGPTTVANGGTGATSFTGGFVKSPGGTGVLTSSATVNAATELSGSVGVNNGGTGATTFAAGFVKTAGGTAAFTASAVALGSEVSGFLPVANGGTGQTSLALNNVLLGNGTSGIQPVAPGTSGNVLTSNGSTWISQAPTGGGAVTSFNGRTGAVVPQGSDYSSFYASTTGSNVTAGSTWAINISGNAFSATSAGSATTAGSVTNGVYTEGNQTINGIKTFSSAIVGTISNATNLNNVAASAYATLANTQTFTGAKTFTGSISSQSYNFNANTSMFYTVGTNDLQMFIGGNQVFKIDSSGNLEIRGATASKVGGGSWAVLSDARLKTNVQNLTGALNKVLSLRPVSYGWKYDAPNEPTVGFIAQEVQDILPNAVTETNPTNAQKPFIPDGEKLLTIGWQNDMIAYLVGAIKELKAEVDSLKAQLAAK
jgi:hypothetical protein